MATYKTIHGQKVDYDKPFTIQYQKGGSWFETIGTPAGGGKSQQTSRRIEAPEAPATPTPTQPVQEPSPQAPVAPTAPTTLPQAGTDYESQIADWQAKEPTSTVGPEWQAWRESQPTTPTPQQYSGGATPSAKPPVEPTGEAGGEVPVADTEVGVGGAGGAVAEATGAPAIPSVQDYAAKLQETTTKQWEDLTGKLVTQREEFETEQKDFLTQIGEKANKDLMDKFETMQGELQTAYQSYWDEQTKALEDLQNQPSYLDQLEEFRQQQGMPQIEQELASLDKTILDTEGLLENLEADIGQRVEGLPVSEAAARRLEAMERKPLSKQLSDQLRARQRVAAGYEAKQAAVGQFMSAAQADIERQRQTTAMGLGFAKEKAEFSGDIATQSFNLFQGLQDRMIEVGKLGLGFAENAMQFRENLATQGFSLFSQSQAQKLTGFTADLQNQLSILQAQEKKTDAELDRQHDLEVRSQDFVNELTMKQFESELEAANPEIQSTQRIEDRSGRVTEVVTWKDGTIDTVDLGMIGKGFAPGTGGGGGYDLGGTIGGALGMSDELANKFNSDFEEEYERLMKGDYGKEGAREKVGRALAAKYPAHESQIWGLVYGNEQFESRFPEGYEQQIAGEEGGGVVGKVSEWEYNLGVRPGMSIEEKDRILREGKPEPARTVDDDFIRGTIRSLVTEKMKKQQIRDFIATSKNLTDDDKARSYFILDEMVKK